MKKFNEFREIFNKEVYAKVIDKKIIIGGYDLSGAFCSWFLSRAYGLEADFILDNELCVYGLKIYRELYLKNLHPENYVGIVAGDRKYEEILRRNGIETIVLEDVFGCEKFGFFEWLEHTYGCDLVKTIPREEFDYDYSLATNSGVSRQMGLMDVVNTLMTDYSTVLKNVLDIGCGKGGAIELFLQNGWFRKVDGIELSKSICDIARKNMELLGHDENSTTITNVSATEYGKYADYDILYMYDPFRGEVFRKAMDRIETCLKGTGKIQMLVYANPYHHDDVVANGIFRLIDTVDTDFFHRDVNIYIARDGVEW